jgi:predicted amidohydrolase YtcJ
MRHLRVPSINSTAVRRIGFAIPVMLGLASSPNPATAADQPVADMVLKNGSIYTVDGERRTVEALAVKDGKIVFVGTNAATAPFVGSRTHVEDARGKLVLPGLIDSHIHPIGIVDFGGCTLEAKPHTLAELATIVRGCVERAHLKPGQWLAVSQWEYAAGNNPDPKHPTLRAALDEAAPNNPVDMTGWDGHHGAYNSAALALARNSKGEVVGYSKKTLATDFVRYQVNVAVGPDGEPSGGIQDDGKDPIDSSDIARDNFAKLLAEPEKLALRLNDDGITAIQDAATSVSKGIYGPNSIYDVYDKLMARGHLSFRVNMAQFWRPEDFLDADGHVNWDDLFAKADAVRRKYAGNPLATADVVKVFADGDVESDAANVPPTFGDSPRPVPYLQPIFERDAQGFLSVKGYVDPGSPQCVYVRGAPNEFTTPRAIKEFTAEYGYDPGQCAIAYGIPQHAPWILNEYVKRAHLAGYTVHIHAISDMASHMAIDALEAAYRAAPHTRPDTIAHLQCATPADVKRIGANHLYIAFTYSWMYAELHGYDMSVVPFFDMVHGNSYEALHNPNGYYERCVYPAKTVMEAGAIDAAGSDAPVMSQDPRPFVNMQFGVTRSRPGIQPISPWQRLTIQDLIAAYTINGARALNRASEIGSLEVGKSADFIVLNQDIIDLAKDGHADKIGETRVLETWFMGRKVYSRPK